MFEFVDVDSMSISRRNVKKKISTNFRVVLTNFLDVILIDENSMSLRSALFDAISIGKK